MTTMHQEMDALEDRLKREIVDLRKQLGKLQEKFDAMLVNGKMVFEAAAQKGKKAAVRRREGKA